MRDNFLLGIDLGTTVCKAGIWSQKGELVTCTHIEYELAKEGGGIVEQDASQWWEVTVQAIRQSIKKASIDKKCVRALSVSSQGISFVPVDEEINPLCRSINWLDTRAEKEFLFPECLLLPAKGSILPILFPKFYGLLGKGQR